MNYHCVLSCGLQVGKWIGDLSLFVREEPLIEEHHKDHDEKNSIA
jgi:hypothetical protein